MKKKRENLLKTPRAWSSKIIKPKIKKILKWETLKEDVAAGTNQTQAEAVEEDEAIKTHILEKLRARTEVNKVREAEEEVTPIFKQKV